MHRAGPGHQGEPLEGPLEGPLVGPLEGPIEGPVEGPIVGPGSEDQVQDALGLSAI